LKQLIRNYLKEQKIFDFNENTIATNHLKITSDDLILSGNRLGLVMLADCILDIALSDNGAHIHLDTDNFFDDAEHQLIIELVES